MAVGEDAGAGVKAPTVCCVVVNWNGWKDTVGCLKTLVRQDYPGLRILVVDNASTDDSVERIRGAFPGVEVLEAGENGGFAAGSNVGIRRAIRDGAEFIWLLNNDTAAPADSASKLVAAAGDPDVGIVGTVLRYMRNPEEVQAWGGASIRRWMGFVSCHFQKPTELGSDSFLTFASVLLRSEMLAETGLLDEEYFMYFEDADLCYRARAAGWRLVVAADTSVLHKEGGSGPAKSRRLDRIVTASGLRFLDRYGRPRWIAKPLYVLSRLGKRVVRGNFGGARAVWRGVVDWRRKRPRAFQEEC